MKCVDLALLSLLIISETPYLIKWSKRKGMPINLESIFALLRVTAWYLSSFFVYLWTEVLPLGLLMLRLFFMESWSCICNLLQVIIPSLMYSEIFQTWPPRNLTGWKGSLTQKIQIGRHQCDLTWLKFRSKQRDLAIRQYYQHIRHINLDSMS